MRWFCVTAPGPFITRAISSFCHVTSGRSVVARIFGGRSAAFNNYCRRNVGVGSLIRRARETDATWWVYAGNGLTKRARICQAMYRARHRNANETRCRAAICVCICLLLISQRWVMVWATHKHTRGMVYIGQSCFGTPSLIGFVNYSQCCGNIHVTMFAAFVYPFLPYQPWCSSSCCRRSFVCFSVFISRCSECFEQLCNGIKRLILHRNLLCLLLLAFRNWNTKCCDHFSNSTKKITQRKSVDSVCMHLYVV